MAVNWELKVKDNIERLEKLKPEDRLNIVAAIRDCWGTVNSSQQGWAQWLTNVTILSLIPKKILLHFLDVYLKTAIIFLKFDIDATRSVEPYLKKRKVKQVKKSTYVS